MGRCHGIPWPVLCGIIMSYCSQNLKAMDETSPKNKLIKLKKYYYILYTNILHWLLPKEDLGPIGPHATNQLAKSKRTPTLHILSNQYSNIMHPINYITAWESSKRQRKNYFHPFQPKTKPWVHICFFMSCKFIKQSLCVQNLTIIIGSLFIPAFENRPMSLMETPLSKKWNDAFSHCTTEKCAISNRELMYASHNQTLTSNSISPLSSIYDFELNDSAVWTCKCSDNKARTFLAVHGDFAAIS